nr:nucleotidyltransferase family protein [Solobacterium sp.]
MISSKYICFLNVLNSGIHGKQYVLKEEEKEHIRELFRLSEIHQVLPVTAEAVYQNRKAGTAERAVYENALKAVVSQTVRTAEFIDIYRKLNINGTDPIVFKGIVLDKLYPRKNYRISADADLLIRSDQTDIVHKTLTDYGLVLAEPDTDIGRSFEIAYTDTDTKLYIEIHKQFFPPDEEAYSNLNQYFTDVYDRKIEEEIYGIPVYTLEYTDHFFYLICHAFKHFLYSGFGIRQVCDIILYANAYAEKIDWNRIRNNCEETNTYEFTKAVLQIGKKYLYPDSRSDEYIEDWHTEETDEEPLLEDIMSGGLYGTSTMTRLHSSTMTLTAVSNSRNNQKRNPLLSTVFLPLHSMEGRYPYLKKAPYLLPAAWVQRIGRYGMEVLKGSRKDNNTADTVALGNHRIELLKYYR